MIHVAELKNPTHLISDAQCSLCASVASFFDDSFRSLASRTKSMLTIVT